jgi:hypothetical protein
MVKLLQQAGLGPVDSLVHRTVRDSRQREGREAESSNVCLSEKVRELKHELMRVMGMVESFDSKPQQFVKESNIGGPSSAAHRGDEPLSHASDVREDDNVIEEDTPPSNADTASHEVLSDDNRLITDDSAVGMAVHDLEEDTNDDNSEAQFLPRESSADSSSAEQFNSTGGKM